MNLIVTAVAPQSQRRRVPWGHWELHRGPSRRRRCLASSLKGSEVNGSCQTPLHKAFAWNGDVPGLALCSTDGSGTWRGAHGNATAPWSQNNTNQKPLKLLAHFSLRHPVRWVIGKKFRQIEDLSSRVSHLIWVNIQFLKKCSSDPEGAFEKMEHASTPVDRGNSAHLLC